jgi:predicted nucleotidyltransferase
MTLDQIIRDKSEDIKKIAGMHGAKNIRIFGSTVRGEESQESDIDFLVDIGEETSSWFPAGLILDLEKILGRRVEVVTENGLNHLLREQILNEAKPI